MNSGFAKGEKNIPITIGTAKLKVSQSVALN
jgi:hypothetical protein